MLLIGSKSFFPKTNAHILIVELIISKRKPLVKEKAGNIKPVAKTERLGSQLFNYRPIQMRKYSASLLAIAERRDYSKRIFENTIRH
jgi:hypothetical protein